MARGLIQWSPGFPMRDFDNFFEEGPWGGADFNPAMDIYQDKDNVIVETSLPGVDPEKVEITIENDVLTVSGQSKDEKEIKKENYYRREMYRGSFSRSVILPMRVKADKAQAQSEKGILKITIPKAEEVKPKKIAIKVK